MTPTDIEGRRFLTVKQACWLMNVSRTYLYDLINRGEIRAVKDGGKRLIERASCDDYRDRLMAKAG